MTYKIKIVKTRSKNTSQVVVLFQNEEKIIEDFGDYHFSDIEKEYIANNVEKEIFLFYLQNLQKKVYIQVISKKSDEEHKNKEEYRIAASQLFKLIKKEKEEKIEIQVLGKNNKVISYLEGLLLSAYSFDKYKTKKKELNLKAINLISKTISNATVEEIMNIVDSVNIARDLINEPGSVLTAEELSKRIVEVGKEAGFTTDVLNKSKIESLKMGGLLAVNYGSIDPPTFNILEWKPKNAINKKPIVFVGKGVVFDTGGISLKPPSNMDEMKSDMSGAAAVVGTLNAISKNKIPVHVIGLIPATDNRPGQNAYYPGDIIKMFDGTTVEVLNTDAEGRMILADALAYAKKYKPELVINLATLTGSAVMAIGEFGTVAFMKTEEKVKNELQKAGDDTYERLVEFPLWEEYAELIKSDIADVKNIGGREAGAITAAKFLERFTDYDFVHLDIAGTAYNSKGSNYNAKGGTGIGVRLLSEFIKNRIEE
ncbi:MAG: leucyl aminopeptidase [Bacteroidota bacterium]|nr:leucyl aminopeptidase [Bacteroidota bacterium]